MSASRAWTRRTTWATFHFVVLVVLLAVVAWLLAGLIRSVATDGTRGLDFALFVWRPGLTLASWSAILLAGAAGVLANLLYATAHHAFVRRDFDPGVIPFHHAKVLHATLVTVVFFALGTLLLPQAVLPVAGALALHAPALAVAFLLGYFSDDAFDRIYRFVRKLLGKDVGPSLGSAYGLLHGVDFPLAALDDVDALVKQLVDESVRPKLSQKHAREAATGILGAARRQGMTYTHEFIAALEKPAARQRLAKAADVTPEAVATVRRFADVARVAGSLAGAEALWSVDPAIDGQEALRQMDPGNRRPRSGTAPPIAARDAAAKALHKDGARMAATVQSLQRP